MNYGFLNVSRTLSRPTDSILPVIPVLFCLLLRISLVSAGTIPSVPPGEGTLETAIACDASHS